jgi:hypothetical protein
MCATANVPRNALQPATGRLRKFIRPARLWCLDILLPVLAILPWALLVIIPALAFASWLAGIGH